MPPQPGYGEAEHHYLPGGMELWDELDKHICSDRFSWILELMEQSSNVPDLIFLRHS